jgi:hypothetical protein
MFLAQERTKTNKKTKQSGRVQKSIKILIQHNLYINLHFEVSLQ